MRRIHCKKKDYVRKRLIELEKRLETSLFDSLTYLRSLVIEKQIHIFESDGLKVIPGLFRAAHDLENCTLKLTIVSCVKEIKRKIDSLLHEKYEQTFIGFEQKWDEFKKHQGDLSFRKMEITSTFTETKVCKTDRYIEIPVIVNAVKNELKLLNDGRDFTKIKDLIDHLSYLCPDRKTAHQRVNNIIENENLKRQNYLKFVNSVSNEFMRVARDFKYDYHNILMKHLDNFATDIKDEDDEETVRHKFDAYCRNRLNLSLEEDHMNILRKIGEDFHRALDKFIENRPKYDEEINETDAFSYPNGYCLFNVQTFIENVTKISQLQGEERTSFINKEVYSLRICAPQTFKTETLRVRIWQEVENDERDGRAIQTEFEHFLQLTMSDANDIPHFTADEFEKALSNYRNVVIDKLWKSITEGLKDADDVDEKNVRADFEKFLKNYINCKCKTLRMPIGMFVIASCDRIVQ